MSASERLRPNQEKYQERKAPMTKRTARNRIGPEARSRFTSGAVGVNPELLPLSLSGGVISEATERVLQRQGVETVKEASVTSA